MPILMGLASRLYGLISTLLLLFCACVCCAVCYPAQQVVESRMPLQGIT
jgi:hypothetical protein